jgi:crotonobetainyl-CoA:carnitine CoA-transferase CaiB-like acyl-CoA transferase
VRALNPRIVFCGTYGYGRRGPYADRPAYDDSIQAAGGIAMLQAAVTGEPGYAPTLVADKTTALAVVNAVLAALFHRERGGAGQEIEVPMFETLVAYVMTEHLYGRAFDPPAGPAGYARILSRQRRPYRTRDGWLAVLPYLDEHWRAFCGQAGRPDLAEDARFRSLAARIAHIEEFYAQVGAVVATRTTAEWLAVLEPSGVPVTTVNSLEDLLDDPHLAAVGFWRRLEHPTDGTLRLPGVPTDFSETPGSIRLAPPRLGEHSLEVLREAGLDERTLSAMLASGATRTSA